MTNKDSRETDPFGYTKEDVPLSREEQFKKMMESYNESQGYSFPRNGSVFDEIYRYVPTKVRGSSI